MHKSRIALGALLAIGAAYGQKGSDIVEVSEEVALEEFFAGIEGDAMMLQVISDMNGLENFLDSRNVTRSAEGELVDEGNLDERTLAAEASLGGLKRFQEFKQLVSWLQPVDKRITRYCFYGCWCLPEGAHGFVAGTGRPVDLVDRSCQQLWFCYTCAMSEFQGIFGGVFKKCNPVTRRYNFKFKYDRFHPKDYSKRDIHCRDDWEYPMTTKTHQRMSCSRAICECDRGAAFRLGRFWRHWDKSRHRIWSISVKNCANNAQCSIDFTEDSEEWNNCRALPENSCLFITGKRCVFGDNGQLIENEDICCGEYEDEGRRYLQKDHGGQFACCAHDTGDGLAHAPDDHKHTNGDPKLNGFPWNGNLYNVLTHCCPHGRPIPASGGGC